MAKQDWSERVLILSFLAIFNYSWCMVRVDLQYRIFSLSFLLSMEALPTKTFNVYNRIQNLVAQSAL